MPFLWIVFLASRIQMCCAITLAHRLASRSHVCRHANIPKETPTCFLVPLVRILPASVLSCILVWRFRLFALMIRPASCSCTTSSSPSPRSECWGLTMLRVTVRTIQGSALCGILLHPQPRIPVLCLPRGLTGAASTSVPTFNIPRIRILVSLDA